MACSGLVHERDPLPDAAPWRGITDRRERLTTGLHAVYDWYERNASLMACVMRDAEHHTLTREIGELQFPDPVGAGFIDSLARPGGNATGFLAYEYSLGAKGSSC
jgi:hypothetical protein